MNVKRRLATRLLDAHPDEAARVLENVGQAEASAVLAERPAGVAAEVLRRMTTSSGAAVLAGMAAARAGAAVLELPLDKAAGLLRRLEPDLRSRLLESLPSQRSRSLEVAMRHQEGTAGALMDPAVLALPDDISTAEALRQVREAPSGAADSELYVVDRDHVLVGVLGLGELLAARSKQSLSSVMRPPVWRLRTDADWRSVLAHPGWREVPSLPVVDARGVLVGALRYQTFRSLEERSTRVTEDAAIATGRDLGGLFWTGMTGVLDALTRTMAPAESAKEARDGTR
jgi:magnesium transporter